MNKQQLAAKIWESANKMRSKIEANEYKDYILGFMFYKFLSDKEQRFLQDNDFTQADIEALTETEENLETIEFIKHGIGYFIAYDNLFSTWLQKGSDFNVANVRDALSAFSRLISSSHKKVFDGIFKTLETGLSKLGDNSNSQRQYAACAGFFKPHHSCLYACGTTRDNQLNRTVVIGRHYYIVGDGG